MSGLLAGRRIVVPEMRELDVLAQMLERQGATAIRCPLVSIHDTPDEAPVVAWLRRFTEHPPDDLILMTGEGLQRLLGFARRAGLGGALPARLRTRRKITRSPTTARRTSLAAVGRVVGRALDQAGVSVRISPAIFHMAQLVIAILEALDLEGGAALSPPRRGRVGSARMRAAGVGHSTPPRRAWRG